MTSLVDPEFVDIFLEEVVELMSDWEKECLSFENLTDLSVADFNKIFRIAHNLKGTSKSIGLDLFGDTIHSIEDVISLLRSDELTFSVELLTFLFEVHSFIVEWAEKLSKDIDFIPDTSKLNVKILKFMEPSGDKVQQQVFEHEIMMDITQKNLGILIKELNAIRNMVCHINIKSEKYDISGIQFLLALKKSFGVNIKFIIDNLQMVEDIKLLGIEL